MSKDNWVGKCGYDQIAAAVSMYGPRTTMIIALPQPKMVFEITLQSNDQWFVSRNHLSLMPQTKYFASANLRAAASDKIYRRIINLFIDEKFTLRYTGGLVPDFVHTLIKETSYMVV